MTITNGYCTLDELKRTLLKQDYYTASTISFTNATSTIGDTAFGLKRFTTGSVIKISGTTNNDGYYTVASVTNAGAIVIDQALTDEAAGTAFTINKHDPSDDLALELAIESASRYIEDYCNRRFYASSETRTYTAERCDVLYIDDLLSVTTLKTDEDGDATYENTWTATTDYRLWPYNAALSEDRPYTRVDVAPDGSYSFPTGIAQGVQIVGSFGYSSRTPAAIKQACILQAGRIFKRDQAPLGVVGDSAAGGELRLVPGEDVDVKALLDPFRRLV